MYNNVPIMYEHKWFLHNKYLPTFTVYYIVYTYVLGPNWTVGWWTIPAWQGCWSTWIPESGTWIASATVSSKLEIKKKDLAILLQLTKSQKVTFKEHNRLPPMWFFTRKCANEKTQRDSSWELPCQDAHGQIEVEFVSLDPQEDLHRVLQGANLFQALSLQLRDRLFLRQFQKSHIHKKT